MTPLRRQYLRLKRQHPDTILFFRLGDFYETFDADAELAARLLQITLTSREMGRGQRVPMAGVPAHSADTYITRLLAAGQKVAVCEQIAPEGAPAPTSRDAPAKGSSRTASRMMDRKVVRVVTPGTVTEPDMLTAARNNYLCAICAEGERAGLAYADVSTGEFAATQFAGPQWAMALRQEIERLQPPEVLVPQDSRPSNGSTAALPDWWAEVSDTGPALPGTVTPVEGWRFDPATAEELLLQRYEVASLEGFGLDRWPQAVGAAGALVAYLEATHARLLASLGEVRSYEPGGYLVFDSFTRRNLEILEPARPGAPGSAQSTLLAVIDGTRTPMGGRLLRRWLNQPLRQVAALQRRQKVIAAFAADGAQRAAYGEAFDRMADLERLANRVVQGTALPRELAALHQTLVAVARLGDGSSAELPGAVAALTAKLDPCPEVASLIVRAVVTTDEPSDGARSAVGPAGEGRLIRPGYSEQLDELIEQTAKARRWIASLEEVERKRTGIKSLKVGYNKVFGYYIQVSNAYRGDIPADYVRRQTLTEGERYITPELKEYEAQVLTAQERIAELERDLYTRLLREIADHNPRLRRTAEVLAQLDVLLGLGDVAVRNRYVCPELDQSGELAIVGGRHPVVEVALERAAAEGSVRTTPGGFVPNECRLDTEQCQIVLLTGPNMAGKSTYLRMVALIVLLAQVGSFVPADQARIGVADRIFTRVGAHDDLATGQSTFMVEMLETATILRHATPQSLVILDEIGRGTSTYDGLAIAQAVVEYLHNHPGSRARTLFATHYHELTELGRSLPRVETARMDVLEEGDQIVFLHRVVPGGADRSYGIHVARLAGVPRAVIRRADEVLRALEDGRLTAPADTPAAGTEAAQPRDRGTPSVPDPASSMQLSLFASPHPLVEQVKKLDLLSMTPMDALNTLFELQERAREE